MLVFATCFLFVVSAHAAVMVRQASELDTDERVMGASKRYRVFSSAVVIYDQCAKDFPAIAEDAPYVKAQLAIAEEKYRQAYHDAYVARVGYPPDTPMIQQYVARIRATQQSVINNATGAIQKEGCRRPAIKNIVDFITKTRHSAPVDEAK